jgi:hypothetical protein
LVLSDGSEFPGPIVRLIADCEYDDRRKKIPDNMGHMSQCIGQACEDCRYESSSLRRVV